MKSKSKAKIKISPTRKAKREAFLAAFAKMGNVSVAAKMAKCVRASHYVWMKDSDYAAEFEQVKGDVILLAVRWYLRYPLAYLHISEILAKRRLFVDASCIWRWMQAYTPEGTAEFAGTFGEPRREMARLGPGGSLRVRPDAGGELPMTGRSAKAG